MSAKDLTQLLNQARVTLTGASDAGLKGELFNVLNEFFSDSNSWLESIPISIVPNTTSYDVTPDGGQIIRLAGVVDVNLIPQPAMMPEFGTIQFQTPYNTAQTFQATVIKTVTQPTDRHGIPVIPDFVLSVYGVQILQGLLGNMMMQPNKSYSSDKAGMLRYRSFRNGVASARVAALRRNTLGVQAWSYPQNFRVGGQRGGVSVGNDTRFQ